VLSLDTQLLYSGRSHPLYCVGVEHGTAAVRYGLSAAQDVYSETGDSINQLAPLRRECIHDNCLSCYLVLCFYGVQHLTCSSATPVLRTLRVLFPHSHRQLISIDLARLAVSPAAPQLWLAPAAHHVK
jgi:hypothetical protein